jgi:hypothetical protein
VGLPDDVAGGCEEEDMSSGEGGGEEPEEEEEEEETSKGGWSAWDKAGAAGDGSGNERGDAIETQVEIRIRTNAGD